MTCTVTHSILEMDQTVLGAGAVSTGTIPAQHRAVSRQSPQLQGIQKKNGYLLTQGRYSVLLKCP